MQHFELSCGGWAKIEYNRREEVLSSWKESKGSIWDFTVDEHEVSRHKYQVEQQLQQQVEQWKKLEREVTEMHQQQHTTLVYGFHLLGFWYYPHAPTHLQIIQK